MIMINNINTGRIYFCGLPKSGDKRMQKNIPIKPDLIYLRPYNEIANEKLKQAYGINSSVKDKRILKNVLSAVKDFCTLNNNNLLFQGLTIEDDSLNDGIIFLDNQNSLTKKYSIVYNKLFDWDNLEKYTKDKYDDASIASANPKYFIYASLAGFLNFQYNPYASRINLHKSLDDDMQICMYRIANVSNMSDFNNSYIAAKMCSEFVPCQLSSCFEDNVGNVNLKFPPKKEFQFVKGSVFHFNTIKKASDYLYNNYKIKADFNNLQYANKCCAAVYDLVEAIGDKDIFEGLVIKTEDIFDDTHVMAETLLTQQDADNPKAEITINPAGNWKNNDKILKREFLDGYTASFDTKNAVFSHELAHYLDFMGNPVRYMDLSYDTYREGEEMIASRVSQYAASHSSEFCAEYVAGRMAGLSYPKIVDEQFEYFWNGPKINFPKNKGAESAPIKVKQ